MIATAAAALAGLHHEDRKGGRGVCRYCGERENNVSYHEAWECPKRVKESPVQRKVLPAPQWLKDRMAKLRALPPPTLEEVRTAWAASAKWQDEYGFDCVEKIKKAKYIR